MGSKHQCKLPMSDDELNFEFGSKKKSAAVETNDDANADEDQLENDGSEGDDGSDGEEHDSEHDDDASDGSTGDADAVPWAGTNRDYTYDELVDRIFSILSADRPDLASGGRKKYQVKPPHVVRDGTRKTQWSNFPEMCRSMNRPASHVQSYVFAELGTHGSVDASGRLIIKGRFQPKQIEKVVRHYITEYVTCRTCRSPE